jgi:hypothetical protein
VSWLARSAARRRTASESFQRSEVGATVAVGDRERRDAVFPYPYDVASARREGDTVVAVTSLDWLRQITPPFAGGVPTNPVELGYFGYNARFSGNRISPPGGVPVYLPPPISSAFPRPPGCRTELQLRTQLDGTVKHEFVIVCT